MISVSRCNKRRFQQSNQTLVSRHIMGITCCNLRTIKQSNPHCCLRHKRQAYAIWGIKAYKVFTI